MSETTTIRVRRQTHHRITRLAKQYNESVDQTVDRALRALRQLCTNIFLLRLANDS